MNNLLEYIIAGNTIRQYLVFIILIIGSIIVLNIFRIYLISRLNKIVQNTSILFDDLAISSFSKNIIPLMYISAIYFGTGTLLLNSKIDRFLDYFFIVIMIFFITRFLVTLIMFLLNNFWLKRDNSKNLSHVSILINTVLKIMIWIISILIILDNLGVKISGLVAGLGIGGIAIAFAAQSILGDIFNYFTIFLDSPFEIGDFLVIDSFSGVVEHIGVKTTRLRSLGGEQLIFANTDLTNSRVRNYKRMQERRVLLTFGVTYQTPINKIKKIPSEIEKLFHNIENTRFDRAHFYKFNDSSLDFEVVYYVLSPEYNVYMDIQQEVNIKIMALLEKIKAEFAYPTRTVYITK